MEWITKEEKVTMPDGQVCTLIYSLRNLPDQPCLTTGHQFVYERHEPKSVLLKKGLRVPCHKVDWVGLTRGGQKKNCLEGEHKKYIGHCGRCSIFISYEHSCVK